MKEKDFVILDALRFLVARHIPSDPMGKEIAKHLVQDIDALLENADTEVES
jgi:hypothetical protein